MKPSFIALSLMALTAAGLWNMGDRAFRQIPPTPDTRDVSAPDYSIRTSSIPQRTVASSSKGAADASGQPFRELAQVTKTDRPVTMSDQPATTASEPAAQPAATPPVASDIVDESALRYFASRGDTARLQAEISRLRALYPNWVPPQDPLKVPQNEDAQLEIMWQLYAQGKYADVRKAITDRQKADAAWKPPADLLDRLGVAEARASLISASDQKQYDTVVRLGSENPSMLTCSEVDILWRVAEAFGNTDRKSRARDAYLYILNNCEVPAERLATVQKAVALLPYGSMTDLLAREKKGPDGTGEFESIRDDLSRTFVADGDSDPSLVVAPVYLTRVEHLSDTQGLASDALLLGWYHLRRQNMTVAEQWFRKAHAKDDSAAASQGLALTLLARKVPLEAEDVMYRWRDTSKEAKATYLAATANLLAIDPPVTLPVDILQRIAAVAIEARDPPTAQQFGWYARGLQQFQTAAEWFAAALQWKPDDEPSAYGLTITREQLGDKTGVAELQRIWSARSQRIATLGKSETGTRDTIPGVAATTADRPRNEVALTRQPLERQPVARQPVERQSVAVDERETVVVRDRPARRTAAVSAGTAKPAGCRTTVNPESLTPAAALPRGWCLMGINRPIEAAEAFEVALRDPSPKTREDAAYGQSLAYLRSGLTAKAAVSAVKAPQNRQRALELQTAILSDRAVGAFKKNGFRETILILDQLQQLNGEKIDLMVLRGYSYMGLRRYDDAARIFEAAAAAGSTDAVKGLANAKEAKAARFQ